MRQSDKCPDCDGKGEVVAEPVRIVRSVKTKRCPRCSALPTEGVPGEDVSDVVMDLRDELRAIYGDQAEAAAEVYAMRFDRGRFPTRPPTEVEVKLLEIGGNEIVDCIAEATTLGVRGLKDLVYPQLHAAWVLGREGYRGSDT